MIKVSLDEAFVFDLLAIFEVKSKNFTGEKLLATLDAMSDLIEEISEQLGKDKFEIIIASSEYKSLVEANSKVFLYIDQVRESTGFAKEVDDANYERYICKTNLQEKFFFNKLTELKNK